MEPALKEDATVSLPGELARVFEAHHRLVLRAAYRVTGNLADAEDVLQNIFLRLLRNQHTTRTVNHEERYLRRAAVNAALDQIRLRHEDRTVPLSEIPVANQEIAAAEMKAGLRRALARLTPRSAEIFALRFFEDLSNQEIARMLGLSRVSVAVMVHRARQQLRRELASYREK